MGPWLVAVLPPASPSPGGGAVGGGAAACSPTVSQEEEAWPGGAVGVVLWAGRGACPPRLSRAGEGRRPRNRVAGDLGLEGLELSDSLAGAGSAARVRALARPSKTTPQHWVYEAGAREGLEI